MNLRHTSSLIVGWMLAVIPAASSLASVGPFVIPVDELASSVTVEVCIPGGCDTDISAVSGFYSIALDDGAAPTSIELHDFDLSLIDPINIDISVFLGGLTALGENLQLQYAQPGIPFGPVPIAADAFAFTGAPTNAGGTVSYSASGTVCAALSASGLPCTDTRDLSQQGTQSSDLAGTIVVANAVATLTANLDILIPLDPNNPSLGTLSMVGTVTGSAAVPEPAPIPTASGWGVAAMSLLVLAFGTVAFRARYGPATQHLRR